MASTETDSNYLRAPQAADYLRISYPMLRKLTKQGEGPQRIKLGKAVVYRRADLDQFMTGRLVAA